VASAAGPTPAGGTAVASAPGGGGASRPLQERLSEQERAEIVAAIADSQGNIAHAARRLGINRSTLYYRLRKHGLEHLLPMKETVPGAAAETPAPATGAAGEPQPQ